jgi:hypothetical protein
MTGRATEFHALYRELRIKDQRQYYQDRRDANLAAHRQAIWVRTTLLVLAGLAGAAGQAVSGTARVWLAIVAAVLVALAGAVTAYGALMGFPRLAKLYSDAELNLAEAEIDWEALEPHGDLANGIDRVEQIFRKENGHWGQLVVEAGSAAEGDTKKP